MTPTSGELLLTRLALSASRSPQAHADFTALLAEAPDTLLPVAFRIALEGSGPVDTAIRDALAAIAADLTETQLVGLLAIVPTGTVALAHTAETFTRTLLQRPCTDRQRSLLLRHLGRTLRGLGRWEEAVPVLEEAVRILRVPAAQDPDSHPDDLADALHGLGRALLCSGRPWKEAEPVLEEAVRILRVPAAEDPDTHQDDLAHALHHLGQTLWQSHRTEEALVIAEEAVQLRRVLAAEDPDKSTLAHVLLHLGDTLTTLGECYEAETAAEEAEAILSPLRAQYPDDYPSEGTLTSAGIPHARDVAGPPRIDPATWPQAT
ncbi:tetratricopeptide repeat protein [Streptomyces sp. NPDC002742]|uniref:tetratricopeptide repeat protein n=1 Tax=Streptomyces sp. NPDC002742 TaxID=3364663 RepID=UPI0036AEB379